MIRLVYSNATEELLTALADAIGEERRAAGALEPVRVVVPNANIETYLKLGLAERAGIAANLEITFLRRFLARVAERALPPARAVDANHIEGCLLAIFHDAARLAEPELGPVRTYLDAAGDAPDAVDRRRYQLAAALARLFDEYASSRPRMLAEWRAHGSARARGGAGIDRDDAAAGSSAALDERGRFAATERWQRALWLAIFGAGGLLAEQGARTGTTFLPLGELLVEAERRLQPAGLGRTLHVFGVSYVAEAYHRMLALLGRHLDVHIYTLNPCREFWEDLDTAHEAARRTKRETKRLFPTRRESRQPMLTVDDDPFALASDAEMLALRLWGRPGRENVRLLNQLTDADFEGRFRRHADSDDAPSLLHRLQDDILDRVARDHPDPSLRADGSISVLPCPGLRRELEVVAAEIWRLVRADPSLRFNQIAVIVPEANKDAYLSQLGAVFGESHDLPWSGIDLPPGHGHGVGEITEIAERLIDLPLGAFTRRELLPLLTHPAILSPARFPGVLPADWIGLCEELAIVHGADHRDHDGTYIHEDLFNWDQGVRRVALGALMTGPRSGDDEPVRLGERDYLPAEAPAGQTAGALGFGLLVRSLIEDARFAAGVTGPRLRPLPEWLELIRGLVSAYVCPADEIGTAGVARTLRALSDVDMDDVAASLGDRPVSYRIAAELCRERLRRIGGERGQHLARGVAVASFVPMRAIPFRAIFLVGLGHGAFPSAPRRDELDLRAARRLPGDVSPREQDLYMFLETLLGARERLVLSYVARDELTGDRLEPSSVILELGDILRRGYLPPAEARRLFDPPAIPLRRFDDDARLDAHPPALRENRARALGRALAEALPPEAPPPELSSLGELLPPAAYHQLTASLGLHRPPRVEGHAPRADAGVTQVSLQTLRQFLEDPLQGAARFRLRMREIEADEERIDRDDEPFESDRIGRTLRLRAAMLSVLARAPGATAFPWSIDGLPTWADVRAAHTRLSRRDELLGQIPTGFFREAEGPAEEEILATWWEHARTVGGGLPAVGRIVRFGRAAELEAADDLRDPIVLSVSVAGAPARRLEIVGRTELLVAPANSGAMAGSLVFSCRPPRRDDTRADRELLRAFLDHVALAAAGLSQGAHEALLAVASGTSRQDAPRSALTRRLFAPVEPARAREYLETLAAELLQGAPDPATGSPTGVHPYLLPHEAVFEAYRKKKDVVDVIEGLCDQYADLNRAFSSGYGPVPQAIERHLPPDSDVAARMVESRFGLLFALMGQPTEEAET